MAIRPESPDECLAYLNNNAEIEAWKIESIDGKRFRHRAAKMTLDANNTVQYISLIPEADEVETAKWTIRAAQHLFDAAEAHLKYVKSGH